MAPGKLRSQEGTLVSSRGAWAGRGLFTVAVHALPGHLPLSQAPAIWPSGVTALASLSLGGRGPGLRQMHHGKAKVLHC